MPVPADADDDVNDLEVLERAGISACPADAMAVVAAIVDYRCGTRGGYGAFREFAECLIAWKAIATMPIEPA